MHLLLTEALCLPDYSYMLDFIWKYIITCIYMFLRTASERNRKAEYSVMKKRVWGNNLKVYFKETKLIKILLLFTNLQFLDPHDDSNTILIRSCSALIFLFHREKLVCLYHLNFDDKNSHCADFFPLFFILLPFGEYINMWSSGIKPAVFCLLTFC